MNNYLCMHANNCGCFNFCTTKDWEECGGKIKTTAYAKVIFLSLLPEFKTGKCAHCGASTEVAQVNLNHNVACLDCWLITILPHRTVGGLAKERGIKFSKSLENIA